MVRWNVFDTPAVDYPLMYKKVYYDDVLLVFVVILEEINILKNGKNEKLRKIKRKLIKVWN